MKLSPTQPYVEVTCTTSISVISLYKSFLLFQPAARRRRTSTGGLRVRGVARNTVRAALASDAPPKYVRPPKGSIADSVEPRIRELLAVYPRMPATVIAERIGWARSIRVLSGRVAQLRPVYLPRTRAAAPATWPGRSASMISGFPDIELSVGYGQTRTAKQLPVLTMVAGYSRWLSAVLIPTRAVEDLFAGWWQLIDALGAVPRVLV